MRRGYYLVGVDGCLNKEGPLRRPSFLRLVGTSMRQLWWRCPHEPENICHGSTSAAHTAYAGSFDPPSVKCLYQSYQSKLLLRYFTSLISVSNQAARSRTSVAPILASWHCPALRVKSQVFNRVRIMPVRVT